MFAAKYRKSAAKIFAKGGYDLSRPIKSDAGLDGLAVIGQTEEKIYEYLKSLGVSTWENSEVKRVGIPYSKYDEIPSPDIAQGKSFNPTFKQIITDKPKACQTKSI